MKVAILDNVHPNFKKEFEQKSWVVDELFDHSREALKAIIHLYDGVIIRSRIKLDPDILQHATNLKFIGRPGAGLENIDVEYCNSKNIKVFRSPEGNRDAVAEHLIGSLLSLFNHLKRADLEVRDGIWQREENRGYELKGKTFAIIGYGYMGKAVAQRLSGFDVNVIAYDKYLNNFSDDFVKESSLEEIFNTADIVSLHTPLSKETIGMVDYNFLSKFSKPIYFINTARGKSVISKDLIKAIEHKKINGACLDVFDFESSSFENTEQNEDLMALSKLTNVVLSPHIAGWTFEAKEKMANVLIEKIVRQF